MKEQCERCHNMVVGQFRPSDTRKWLTTLAKKGGMKAVLTAAGSAIPGFGNVSGFIAGAAIDVIYGKDINKLVDKVADAFDDNKIYVFTCPNCGHTWTRKEEYLDVDEIFSETSTSSTSSSVRSSSDYEDNANDVFNERFDAFLEKVDDAIENREDAENLAREMNMYATEIESTNIVIASQYRYLAGICMLLYAKQHYQDKEPTSAMLAETYLKVAYRLFEDDEYRLMLAAAKTLNCSTPEQCIKEKTIETAYYEFENETLFKQDWLIETYESCRFKSIIHADDILDDDENYDETGIALWKSGLNLQDKDYRMVCNLNLFMFYDEDKDKTSTGAIPLKFAKPLNDAYNTEGYSIEQCDINNPYHRDWLEANVYYAQSIINGINPYVARNIDKGLDILDKITELDNCYAVTLACETLGKYYEEGIILNKNIAKAISYYKKAGLEEDVARLMNASKNQNEIKSSDKNILTDAEVEYAEEVKACLENGVISNGERRLLEKLRVKLGISESRATEIEASLLRPQLTEAEQEYLAEYKECLADGGGISAGERRLLNRLRDKLGISEERANELEK